MNKKLVIGLLAILLIAVIIVMVNDLYFSEKSQENPYELNTDSLMKLDTNLVCYNEVHQIPVQMDEVNGIAIDDLDNIVVAGSYKIIVFNKDYKVAKSIKIGDVANCIAVNSKHELFLGVQNHMEVWDEKGTFIRRWETKNVESILTGIAVNDSSVFVADANEKLVYQYNLKGKLINEIAKEDSSKGIPGIIIRSPFFDVSMGRDGEVWVANPGRYSLEAYDVKGNLKTIWGKSSEEIDGFCGCCNPTNFAVLSDGSFVTSEKAIPRVKIYSPAGEFKCVVAEPEKFEDGTKGLDVAVDSRNRIYVLDPVRKQIRIFEKK